ncbi:MAG: hypothetical protein IT392_10850 [Nitrospirae bacterium]|nr:hypothetical protein [Nitrospirota bacterium]
MTSLFWFLFAIAVIVLSGVLVLTFARVWNYFTLFTGLAISFMLGMGVISLQMFAYSQINIPFKIYSIAFPWIILAAAAVLIKSTRERLLTGSGINVTAGLKDISWPEVILLLIILSQVFYAFLFGALLPIRGWDALQTWAFKGKVFFYDMGISSDFLKDPLTHPDYPLLIPLTLSWLYTSIGHVNDEMARIIYPMQYVSMLAIFYYAVRKTASKRMSLLFTALLSLTPIVMVHSSGFAGRIGGLYSGDFVGYADLALSIFFLGAGAFFYLYMMEGSSAHLIMAVLFLTMGAWTKNEGLVFLLMGGMLITVNLFFGKRIRYGAILAVWGFIWVVTLPWLLYKMHFHISSEYTPNMNAATMKSNLQRLPYIIKMFFFVLFRDTDLYNYAWYGYLISSLVNLRESVKKPLFYMHALLLGQFAAYTFIYLISPLEIKFHIETSIDRVIIHLTPLAIMVLAMNINRLITKGDRLV